MPNHEQIGKSLAGVKRVSDLIEESKDWVIERWLERVKANAELRAVNLSDPERKDHVPDLLDEAVARACGHQTKAEERQKAAERHGTLRYHQGYSVPMLILEAHLLQDVIAECIRDNILVIDLSSLMPEIAKISAIVIAELEESARAYMKQYEWRSSRPEARPR